MTPSIVETKTNVLETKTDQTQFVFNSSWTVSSRFTSFATEFTSRPHLGQKKQTGPPPKLLLPLCHEVKLFHGLSKLVKEDKFVSCHLQQVDIEDQFR